MGYQSASHQLRRITAAFESPPLSTLERASLPRLDFSDWWEPIRASVNKGAMGAPPIEWPVDIGERVALQLEVLRFLSSDDGDVLDFAMTFCRVNSSRYDDHIYEFSETVLRPFVRDVARIAERQPTPEMLTELLSSGMSATGEPVLDDLLKTARDCIRDPNPDTRRHGLEKLWAAWERLKTLDPSLKKRDSIQKLLASASPNEDFRDVLESEARALTDIGNQFQIRHFEIDRTPISDDAQVYYLFHRLWALIWFITSKRSGAQASGLDG
jgi:hypothetical protein